MKKAADWLALLLAGSLLFCGGGTGCVKDGVEIDGVLVGGLPYAEAEEKIRAQSDGGMFVVRSENGDLVAELTVTDNLTKLVRKAKNGQKLHSTMRREWADAEIQVELLCKRNAKAPVDATVTFTKEGQFFYTEEQTGVACLYQSTLDAVFSALRAGKTEARLITRPVPAAVTKADLISRTKELSRFSTRFDSSNRARSHNITLAAARISGTVLPAGGEFSFNEVVGKRTPENGFMEAAVIFDGEFVQGVGGGVCQTSTTLMNAALRAGLSVTESRPHSLSVSYVPPSLDAMVSEYSDLKFVNPYPYPVYIAAETKPSSVTFIVYGFPDGKAYRTESRVLFWLEPPPEQVTEGEEDKVVKNGRQGLASESYLLVYENGMLVSRTLFRRDTYAAVRGIRMVKRAEQEENGAPPPGLLPQPQ